MTTQVSYHHIMDNIGEAMFIHDAVTGKIIDVNSAALQMFGIEKHEIVGLFIDNISYIDGGYSAKKGFALIKRAKKNEYILTEWKAVKKDGTVFWAEISLKYTMLNNQQLVIVIARDITAKKVAEQKIKQLNYFQLLLSNVSAKLISIPANKINHQIDNTLKMVGQKLNADRVGVFIYKNGFSQISNTNEWCAIGIGSHKKMLQKLNLDNYTWLHKFMLNNKVICINNVENTAIGNNVVHAIKSMLIAPIFFENIITGFIMAHTINNTANWDSDSEYMIKSVGNIVGQAIVRLNYEDELKKAKAKAEESDRLKTAFLSNMSHEIRTPMNGILGFAELLADPLTTEKERFEYIKIINESGNQLLSIINDIIDIAKIESGQISLNIETVNICSVVQSMVSFFKPIAEAKGVKFIFENLNIADSCTLKTDVVKIKQILTNIINNAIKFTNSGYIKFTYKPASNKTVFIVEDTGIGMDYNIQQKIFERFIRADNPETQAIGGTGLGLAISKSFAIMLGGDINLESKKGYGSKFTIILPNNTKNNCE